MNMRDYSIPLSDTNQNKGTMALFLSHTPYNVMKQGQKKNVCLLSHVKKI